MNEMLRRSCRVGSDSTLGSQGHGPRDRGVGGRVLRSLAAACAIGSLLAVSALAADPPNDDEPCGNDGHRMSLPIVGPPGAVDPCAAESRFIRSTGPDGRPVFTWTTTPEAPFPSACWHSMVTTYVQSGTPVAPVRFGATPCVNGQPTEYYQPTGFRLNWNLLAAPAPGDFLPPATTLGQSSVCLLPPGAAAEPTGWQGLNRPVLADAVDLITGVPLISVTDLELPFGGAVFRLTRTRSSVRRLHNMRGAFSIAGADLWWDWLGSGWMVGENPFLIVDAALPDVVGDSPRTCWVVLDALHSIPFQLIESSGRYEAPPRFRARLDHNGVWDPSNRCWYSGHEPTTYYVDLYDGQLRYTFGVIREDVPENIWNVDYPNENYNPNEPSWECSHYHDRPILPTYFPEGNPRRDVHDPYLHSTNPGFGIPYYGLCTLIEDRFGHAVEISYCSNWRAHLDDPETTECTECRQACIRRGQISHVKLRAGNDVRWTLVYAHRLFKGDRGGGSYKDYRDVWYPEHESTPGHADIYTMHGAVAIDRIYVYEGDIPDAVLESACLTISHLDATGFTGGIEPLLAYNAAGGNLPTNWRHQVRYFYDIDTETNKLRSPPLLLKTAVTTRHGAIPEPTNQTVKHTVFHYHNYSPMPGATHVASDGSMFIPWLEALFLDEDIARLLSLSASEKLAAGLPGDFDIDDLARRDFELRDELRPFATMTFDPAPDDLWDNFSTYDHPDPDLLFYAAQPGGPYITRNRKLLTNDSDAQTVGMLSARDESGRTRYYRINRLRALPPPSCENFDCLPDPVLGTIPSTFWLMTYPTVNRPHRSVFSHPFLWHGYRRFGTADLWEFSTFENLNASLDDPRWIAIIDEFSSYEEMADTNTSYAASSPGTKAGQLSRRVVEMNPTGFVLSDRTWEFTPDGTIASGGGLGEQYIYTSVQDYFYGTANQLADPPSDYRMDDLAAVRRELLLTEHRSVGWSVAQNDPAIDETDQGLIRFYEYDISGDSNSPWTEREVELVAEGIRRGTQGQRLYTRQHFREIHSSPTGDNYEVQCSLEFLDPQTSTLQAMPPLQPAGPSATFGYSATYNYTYRLYEQDVPFREQRVISRMVVGPPRQVRPQSDWYFPVEREFYTEDGNAEWAATGLVTNPHAPVSTDASNPLASLTLTYYARDEFGRASHTVVDAVPGTYDPPHPDISAVSVGGPQQTWPDPEWQRIPASTAATGEHPSFITSFGYDYHGLCDTYFPNGRRWARRLVLIPAVPNQHGEFVREFVFNDLIPVGGGAFVTESVGNVKDYAGSNPVGMPIKDRRVTFTNPVVLDFGHTNQPQYTEQWRIELRPDANGRFRQADLLERDPTGALLAVGSTEYNDIGEVIRRREIDGTITRQTRDPLGHVLRTYVGTIDDAWLSGQHNPATNNMVLVERTEYGSGVNDAWLPTVVRRYTSNPSWAMDYHGEAPVSDADGIATVTRYDWRMRPVRVDRYAKGDPATAARLSTTLTYLDHADRVRFVVTYGAGAPATFPAGIEPSTLEPLDPLPDARALFSTSPKPVSIVEMRYGPDGTQTERLVYDMAWTPPAGDPSAQPPFHAERQYTGHGGQQVFSQRPGQPVQITRLDSLGRTLEVASVLPSSLANGGEYELTRTDSIYDADGNVTESIRWERVVDDAQDRLTLANAVRTRTVNWYNVHKRLIATADLGTEQASGFIAGPMNFVRGLAPSATVQGGTLVVDRQGVPDGAALHLYSYDAQGNQTRIVAPAGGPDSEPGRYTVTEMEYTSTGRLLKKIENRYDPNPNLRRETFYTHQYGRLVGLTAQRTNVQVATNKEETKLTYGADILDANFTPVSRNNGLIGLVRFPDASTGEALISDDKIRLRYTFSGQVAERIDARGVVFRYRYDDLDRLASVEVGYYDPIAGNFVAKYPPSMTPSTGEPVDRVGYVAYAYDSAGRLLTVTAYTRQGGTLIAQNRYAYDARGNITAELQAHGQLANAGSPRTNYSWQYQPSGLTAAEPGFLRLTSITYPAQPNAPSRTITISYGASGSVEDQLVRPVGLSTNLGSVTNLARFTYSGSGRRVSLATAGNSIVQSYFLGTETVPGLLGLDTYGRIQDLHFRGGPTSTGATLFRARYAYDEAGNRIAAELTQVTASGTPDVNTHSQLNTYDALGRLIKTEVGSLTYLNGQWSIDPLTLQRTDSWQLDLLGNWVGGAQAGTTGPPNAGRQITDANNNITSILHVVNGQNEITAVTTTDSSGSSTAQIRHDEAGNLIFDGEYFYQYDAWNRLVQVNRATLDAQDQIVIGALLKHHTYDGLGRLICTQSPFPDPDTAQAGHVRSERFFYDGVRRIQEVSVAPMIAVEAALGSGDPVLEQLAAASLDPGSDADGAAAPLALEQGLAEANGNDPPPWPTNTHLAREYVWGPGDNGVDELLVHYDHQRLAMWPIQDAGGDIVALADRNGGNPVVAAQWRYDAYGAVLHAEEFSPAPRLHLGHKGLFLDRLDAGVGSSSGEPPRLAPYAHGVYQIRNRAYSPALGRFYQRDPNATAMVLLESSAYHGRGIEAIASAFDLDGLYGDGANLYEYLGSSPWQRRDPMGLSWDPFDAVDEYLAEAAGSIAAWLSALGQDTKAVAVVAATIASYLPFPFVGNLGEMALYALGEQSEMGLATAMALGVVPGGKLARMFAKSRLGGFLGRVASAAWGTATSLASSVGSVLANKASGLFSRAKNWFRASCGCFEAGTLVWTERGPIPIQEVRDGDFVWAQNELTGQPELRQVIAIFSRPGAPIVEVFAAASSGEPQTLRTTEEHPFWVCGRGWVPAQGLQPGATLRTQSGEAIVVGVRFTAERATVYNFEVEGLHTYLVGADGVLVHNAGACPLRRATHAYEFHHFLPRAFWKDFRKFGFTRNELEELGEKIATDWHKRIHGKGTGLPGSWNDRWEKWLDARPNGGTKQEVLDYLEQLKLEFGFYH